MSGEPSRFQIQLPSWVVSLILILCPLVALWPGVFGGKILGPFDAISKMVPAWETHAPQQGWDILQADGALQFYGWRDLVFEAHRTGVAPSWNPYQLAGTPLLANSQSAGYYPLHVLAGWSGLPTGTAIILLAWIHLAIAALGVRALARRLGAGEAGAAFGGIVFALSPFAIAWTALPSVMTTCAWIPVALAALHAVLHRPGPTRTVALAASIAMLATGGHLQFFFYGVIALLIGGIAMLFPLNRSKWVGAGLAVVAALVGIGAGWCQIGPALAFSEYSHRSGAATAQGFKTYQASAIKPFELVGIVAPGFLGSPTKNEPASEEPIPSYWPMQIKPGGNYAESALYLGIPLLLTLLLVRRHPGRYWAAPIGIGLFGTLAAFGTPINALLYYGIPGFSATGSPGRAAVLAVLGACVVGAMALPCDSSETHPKRPAYRFFVLLAICGITIMAMNQLGSLSAWIPGASVQVPVARRLVETTPFLIISLVLAGGAWWCWEKKGWLWLGTAFGIVAHFVIAQTQILPFSRPIPGASKPTLETRFAFVNEPWDFFRPVNALNPPNTSTLLRMQDIGGYDSLIHRDTVSTLREINGKDPAPAANGNMMFVKYEFNPDRLAEAGVTEVWSRLQLPQMATPPEVREGFFVYPLPGPGITESGQIVRLDTSGFTARFDSAGTHTVRYFNLPGWSASIDGKSVLIEGDRWLRITTEGPAEVRFDYHPPGGTTPLPLHLLAVGGLVALMVTSREPRVLARQDENLVQSEADDPREP